MCTVNGERKPEPIAVRLMLDLVWPAAAGNVFWALATVGQTESWASPVTQAKLVMLAMTAVYLAADWIRSSNHRRELRPYFWLFGAPLAFVIIGLAIATQRVEDASPPVFPVCWLSAVFLVGIGGAITGAWMPTGEKSGRERWYLGVANLVGLAILLGFPIICKGTEILAFPVSASVVVLAWGYGRFRLFEGWRRTQGG